MCCRGTPQRRALRVGSYRKHAAERCALGRARLQWNHAEMFEDVVKMPILVRRYVAAALDVARHARWNAPPKLIDLVAGGWRNLLCDQPDVLYSVGALNVQRGRVYELQIPASAAVYTIVTVSNLGGQAFWDIEHTDRPEAFNIAIADGAKTGVDTTSHQGLCMLLVRQYFRAPVGATRHLPSLTMIAKEARPRRSIVPAPLVAGIAFVTPRLLSLLQARIRGPRLETDRFVDAPRRRSKSEFIDAGRYLVSRFALRPGEVLQVDYDARGALWFAFSVSNFHLENIAHINSYQLERNTDGTYTIYVVSDAARAPNELSTAGLRSGILIMREVRPARSAALPICRTIRHRPEQQRPRLHAETVTSPVPTGPPVQDLMPTEGTRRSL